MLTYALQGIGYGFAAAAQPGPFQTYVISQALSRGWRRTLPAALAPLVSDGPIILLAVLLLSRVPGWLQRFLYVAGGLFVLYLAWGAYRRWRDFEYTPSDRAGPQSLLRAATMNLLSPGVYVFWSLVTGPILVAAWRRAAANGIGFLAGMYGTIVATTAGIIVLFGSARHLGPRVTRALLGVSAVALAGFGLVQLWQGVVG